MPTIPDGSAFDYIGFLCITFGLFFIAAGLGIIKLKVIKVKPGIISCGFGVCLTALGFFLLLWYEDQGNNSDLAIPTVEHPPVVTPVDLDSTPCGKAGKDVSGWCWDNEQGSEPVLDTLVGLYSSDGKSIWVSVRNRNAEITVNGETLKDFSDEDNNGIWDAGYFRGAPWDVTVNSDGSKEQYDVTFTVLFKRVAIKTVHDRYVTAMPDTDYDWVLRAETKDIKDWEKFTLLCQDNGKIALQTCHKDEDGNSRLSTAMGEDYDWVLRGETVLFKDYEEFTLLDADTGMWRPCSGVIESLEKYGEARVAFQTWHEKDGKNRLVTAMDAEWDWVLRAETNELKASEKFTVMLLPDD